MYVLHIWHFDLLDNLSIKDFKQAVLGYKCTMHGVHNELIPLEHKSYRYLNTSFFHKIHIIVKFSDQNSAEFRSKGTYFLITYVCISDLVFPEST